MLDFIKKVTTHKPCHCLALGFLINCFLLLSVGVGLGQARRNIRDVVYLKNSQRPETGEIIKEDFKKVEVRISSGKREFLLKDIRNIRYDGESTKYLIARREMKNEQYAQAVKSYEEALKEKSRGVFRQHMLYHLALCCQQDKQYDKAIQAYDDLLNEISDTRYFKEAQLNKVGCYLEKQKPKEALGALDKAVDLAYKIEIEKEFIFRLVLRKGNVLEGLDPEKAIVSYKRVEREMSGRPMGYQALAGIGRCYYALKRYVQAEEAFKKVVARSKDFVALGSAYAGLGDGYLKQAQASPSWTSYKKAIMEGYLRSWVLYYPPEGESLNDYIRSGYWVAYCFEMMSNLSKDKELGDKYREYAKTTYGKVRMKFPGTIWAGKSKERLSEMR